MSNNNSQPAGKRSQLKNKKVENIYFPVNELACRILCKFENSTHIYQHRHNGRCFFIRPEIVFDADFACPHALFCKAKQWGADFADYLTLRHESRNEY